MKKVGDQWSEAIITFRSESPKTTTTTAKTRTQRPRLRAHNYDQNYNHGDDHKYDHGNRDHNCNHDDDHKYDYGYSRNNDHGSLVKKRTKIPLKIPFAVRTTSPPPRLQRVTWPAFRTSVAESESLPPSLPLPLYPHLRSYLGGGTRVVLGRRWYLRRYLGGGGTRRQVGWE